MESTSPLPTKNGIGPSRVSLPEGCWSSVFEFLCSRFPSVDEDVWRARMQRGLVVDDLGRPMTVTSKYRVGAVIHYYRELETETAIPFEASILFRNDHLLIADKPHFLPVMPAGRFLVETLLVRLKRLTGLENLSPLHRIDRGTAGLVAFSVNPKTRGIFQSLFAARQVIKSYLAVAARPAGIRFPLRRHTRIAAGDPFFTMREWDGEPNAETHIEIARDDLQYRLYRLRPVTGKKHQLRVHMSAIGAPILNDPIYPQLLSETRDDWSRPLQLLAKDLEFRDPLTGDLRRFESERQLSVAPIIAPTEDVNHAASLLRCGDKPIGLSENDSREQGETPTNQ